MTKKKTACLAVVLIIALMVVDQVIKIWVKTNMHLYESIWIADWFQIHFIENNGMAFGLSFINKYVLTIFRIVAVVVIGIYLRNQIRRGARSIYVVLLSMLLAGAAGNIIDCMFYGEIFTASSPSYISYLDACVSVSVIALFLFCRKELATLTIGDEKPKAGADGHNEANSSSSEADSTLSEATSHTPNA